MTSQSVGRCEWRWKGLEVPRPLYGLNRLAAVPDAPVIVTEGEKKPAAAERLFPDHVAITSPNGARAVDKADWTPLKGRRVVIWPDKDDEGTRYAADVAKAAMAAGTMSVAIVQVPDDMPDGWDLADDPPDGWDAEMLRGLLDAAHPYALSSDTEALIANIRAAVQQSCVPMRLVVIDTLSRAMAGGNENAPDDMGALVTNADRIRQETDAHLMFIHHSGKDATRGARGHSLLRAAADTEIEVTRNHQTGTSVFKVTKQRDLPLEGEFAFRLEQVELGVNRRGKAVTSCVAVPAEGSPAGKPVKLSPKERLALAQLKNCLADHGEIHCHRRDIPHVPVVKVEQFRDYLKRTAVTDRGNPDNERTQFKRIHEHLAEKGFIRIWDGLVWLTSQDVTAP